MYYIDGNNLAGAHPTIELKSGSMRTDVMQLIREWTRHSRKSVTVAFDGHVLGETNHTVDASIAVIYPSARESNADDALIRAVQHDSNSGNAVFVTNDRALQRRARETGVGSIMSCDEFLELVKREQHKEAARIVEQKPRPPQTAGEVDDWVAFFRDGGVEITDKPIGRRVDKKYKK